MAVGAHGFVRTAMGAFLRAVFTPFGLVYGDAANGMSSTAALTDGQLVVGQTNGAPKPVSMSGDATMDKDGIVTVSGGGGGSGVTLDTAQTITGIKSFQPLCLAVWNAVGSFKTSFVSLASGARTVTFPDADLTVAQAGVNTGSAGGNAVTGNTASATAAITVGGNTAADGAGATSSTAPGVTDGGHTHTFGPTSLVVTQAWPALNAPGTAIIGPVASGDTNPDVTITTQIDSPRNVQVHTGSGPDAWASTADVVVTITGTRGGTPGRTATITIPHDTAPDFVIAESKAFDLITNITWTTPAGWTAGKFTLEMGGALGIVINLPGNPTSFNVYKELAGGVNVTPGTLGDATYIPTGAVTAPIQTWLTIGFDAPATSSATTGLTVNSHSHSGPSHSHSATGLTAADSEHAHDAAGLSSAAHVHGQL